jgi:myo-inositol 2-dehydrogenase/D-chiro-inositol 1-dehydrogenase
MVTVGLLGTAETLRDHAAYFGQREDVTIAAIATPRGAPDSLVERYAPAAIAVAAGDGLLSVDPDALAITASTSQQWDLVRTALERGIGVFWATPSVPAETGVDVLVDAAEASSSVLMLDQPHRFGPDYREVRRTVERQGVGEVSAVHVTRRQPCLEASDRNGTSDERRVSPLVGPALPAFAYLRSFLGDLERVYATGQEWTVDDARDEAAANCLLRFESGAIANVELYHERRSPARSTTEIEVSGTTGRVSYDSEANEAFASHDRTTGDTRAVDRTDGTMAAQLERFLSCVTDGARPPMTVADAADGLRVAIAATDSLARNRPVEAAEVAR